MNMHKKNYLKLILVFGVFISFWSCDDDFIETGGDLINSLELPPLYETDNVIAYSKRVNRVQTNNLTMYSLGDYADPVFGNFQPSVLTQLQLSQTNNNFGTDPVLDSVTLTLPFFSRQISEVEYQLDSVYGEGEVVLKVFRSNQFLRSINPGSDGEFTEDQLYYSNQLSEFLPNIENQVLAESEPFRLEDFTEPIQIIQRSGPDVIDTLLQSPRLRLDLPIELFNEVIFDKIGQPELASNANFQNFFRGLYFRIEKQDSEGALMKFNLEDEAAGVTLHYQTQRLGFALEDEDEPELQTNWNRFRLNFQGIKVNLFEDNFIIDASNPNTQEGDENLYLKGGAGYYSVVELFTGPDSDGDGISDELQDLRDRDVLINEANLEFFVNEDMVTSNANRLNRIILFNLDDNTVLIDYFRDRTAGDSPGSSRISHLGPLSNPSDEGRRYRLRITDYINQVVSQDSTNVKLGLMVTDNVNSTVQLKAETSDDEIENIFRRTAQFTKGTVLHGSNSPNQEKRVKLKIQLTEIN